MQLLLCVWHVTYVVLNSDANSSEYQAIFYKNVFWNESSNFSGASNIKSCHEKP